MDTTGLPAAMYSGVLVGLMNRVASLRANGSRATSQPAMYPGSSSYCLRSEVVDVGGAAAARPDRS